MICLIYLFNYLIKANACQKAFVNNCLWDFGLLLGILGFYKLITIFFSSFSCLISQKIFFFIMMGHIYYLFICVLHSCLLVQLLNWLNFPFKYSYLCKGFIPILALIYIYMMLLREQCEFFLKLWKRDAVLWTAMLAGYAQHEEPMLALSVFRQMVSAGVALDGVVMISLLLACGQLGWLKHGKSVHGWITRRCLALGLNLGNALVYFYVKCAALGYSYNLFDKMPERDVISWSSIILGYGLSGNVDIALDLFDRMRVAGVKPNDVTFLGALSACTHTGMVERAHTYFEMMKEYGVAPELKHYACMVDCLGRAGMLEDAERFIEEMPVEADGAVLGALLGGCRVHGNAEVGERVAKKLMGLEPEKASNYVMLANIYAGAGRFEDAEKVRQLMKQRKLSKVPGCSFDLI
ncbi:unnamed protein product, partial [Vitis vinifera]